MTFLERTFIIWGVFWGSLSLVLFFLGLSGLWFKPVLAIVFIVFLFSLLYFFKKRKFYYEAQKFGQNLKKVLKKDYFLWILLGTFSFLVGLYFLGAIAPEKEFDALWYHLTLPKIWLLDHKVQYIPGGLLYYSVMPRLSEMLYGLTLVFDSMGILAKLLHFSFGILWMLVNYRIFRIYFSQRLSLVLAIIIYSLPVVSWLSSTAYVDLITSFYVACSLWGFLKYFESSDLRYLFISSLMMGFNLESKLYGWFIFGTLALILLFYRKFKALAIFVFISIAMALPYLLSAYLATKNPIYPVFSIDDSSFDLWIEGASGYKQWLFEIWPKKIFSLFWQTLTFRLTPLFGLVLLLPLVAKRQKMLILVLLIFIIFFLAWSLHPLGELRYFMVILPMLGIFLGYVLTGINSAVFRFLCAALIVLGVLLNIHLTISSYKLPLELTQGRITQGEYLERHIGGIWFNFYDKDGYFTKNLVKADKVITINYHNLFYIEQNFADWSYVAEDRKFTSAEELQRFLKEQHFTHVAITVDPLEKYFNFDQKEVEQYFEKVYQGEFSIYYKIR